MAYTLICMRYTGGTDFSKLLVLSTISEADAPSRFSVGCLQFVDFFPARSPLLYFSINRKVNVSSWFTSSSPTLSEPVVFTFSIPLYTFSRLSELLFPLSISSPWTTQGYFLATANFWPLVSALSSRIMNHLRWAVVMMPYWIISQSSLVNLHAHCWRYGCRFCGNEVVSIVFLPNVFPKIAQHADSVRLLSKSIKMNWK